MILIVVSAALESVDGEPYQLPPNPRTITRLTDNWRHVVGDPDNAHASDFDDSAWALLNLPHCYNASDGADGGDYYRGKAWYRKWVDIPAGWADRRIYLQFDGVSMAAEVFIDGAPVALKHFGGVSRFNYDVTDQLPTGTHLIAVQVDNSKSLEQQMPPQAGDYTKSGGIYRSVELIAVAPLHIAMQESLADTNHAIASRGVYCSSSNISPLSAALLIKTKLDNHASNQHAIAVVSVLVDAEGSVIVRQESKCTLEPGQRGFTLDQIISVKQPRLWNARIDPYLYDVYVEVRDDVTKVLVDLIHVCIGIRSFVVDPQNGFILNGALYDLHGANAHQDEMGKGFARSDAEICRDIDLMLEMGATAVRTAHYPACQALYDYADKTGLVVYTEIAVNGTSNGGRVPRSDEFLGAARNQMRELIRENFNHPSIIVWGLYNELRGEPTTVSVIENLQALTKEEERLLGNLGAGQEPLRRTTAATWNKTYGALESITDTVGFNKYYGWYEPISAAEGFARDFDSIHASHPTVPIGVAEFGAGANINHHEGPNLTQPKERAENPSQSQWHPEERQTRFHEQWWKELAPRNYLWYKLVWQMFDSASDGRHEGNLPGINNKGLVTADRSIKKDAYFYYKANWNRPARSWANLPTLHITERRWEARTAGTTLITVFSNLESPNLTINHMSLGHMTSLGFGTYVMDVSLSMGRNEIEVSSSNAGQQLKDLVVWTCQ